MLKRAYQIEDAINNLDRKITDYLVEISSVNISPMNLLITLC